MSDPQRVRELFDELADLSPADQLHRLEQIREQDMRLASDLWRLLEIDRDDARSITQASKIGIALTLREAETQALLNTKVDRFTLVEEIGRGGVGVVFKAIRLDGELQHVVAIKMLQNSQLNKKSVDRFLREQAFLANLKHPNICEFIDSGVSDSGAPYVVMELLEGRDLLRYAREERLDIEQRIRLFQKVLLGVEFAHRNLVIHRDLKPTNIIVDQHGTPKLVDFGIAQSVNPKNNKETEQWFTAQYCAPEQLLGSHLTTSCDIYSLGVILFELLADKTPFQSENISSLEFQKQILEIPAPLMRLGAKKKRLWQSLSEGRLSELDCVTQKALRKEPGERYLSASDFAQDLEHWLNRMPVRAKGNHLSYRFKKFLQRNQIAVAATGLVCIVLLTAVFEIVRQGRVATLQRNRAELALSIMTDAFTSADPLQAAKGEINVRSVLKASSKRLLELDSERSQDLVNVGLKIAEVQSRLGLTQDSKLLAGIAYEKAVALGDEESRVALNRLRIQAEITAGDFEKAKRLIEQETNAEARLHPEFLLLKADSFAYVESEFAQKEQWLLKSLKAFETQLDAPSAVTAHLRLAQLNYRMGRNKEAVKITDDTLEKFKNLDGVDSPSVLRVEFYKLNLQERLGGSKHVVQDGLALLPRIERVYGTDSSIFGGTHSLLANAYRNLKQPVEAVKHNRVVYLTYKESMGAMNESTLREHLNLAFTLKRVPEAQAETIETFQQFVRQALSSNVVDEQFRHYGVAAAALYFRDIGRHRLALDTLAHPEYEPNIKEWSAERRADFANDLWLIAVDAGCVKKASEARCVREVESHCLLAVKRICDLNSIH